MCLFGRGFLTVGIVVISGCAVAAPSYSIVDVGLVRPNDSANQAWSISPNGIITGRSVFASGGASAYTWTQGGGIVGLPNLSSPARNYSVGNGVNNSGVVAGTGATTLSGSSPLPLLWSGGSVSQLALPAGQTLGRAQAINASGTVVGSVNGGVNQVGVIWNGGVVSYLSQTTAGGSYFVTAFGINDAGLVAGQGIDPLNAARNVGIVYDSVANTTFEVGALPGMNGALAFSVANGGYVVGSSMFNQGSGMPFIWTQAGGMVAIPLAAGTSQGSAKAANSQGWAVGTDSSAFAIPFLYDGTNTYRLADLIPGGTGWDLSSNTSSSAMGISDGGIITGTGLFNGQIHAYAMIPQAVPEPCSLLALGAGVGLWVRRRRRA